MKYFLIFIGIILVFTFSIFDAYGLWIQSSPQELIKESKTIFVGNITGITEVERQYQSQIASDGEIKEKVGPETIVLNEYTVKIEEFLKNPQETNTVKVLGATVSGGIGGPTKISGFEIGDRVLFYLPNKDNQTHFPEQYLPESFKIPQECDAKTVINQSRIELKNSFNIFQDGIAKKDKFTAGIPMKFVYSKDMNDLDSQSIDVTVSITPEEENKVVFEKKIHVEPAPCSWIASAEWEFTPKEKNYRMYLNISENGETDGSASYTGFSVISQIKDTSPLNQFKSGISFDQIYCKENLTLVKKIDGTPACVKPETKEKLKQRDWLKHQFSFCGANGFDSKGNLNKTNSTHQWNENECEWSEMSNLPNKKEVHSLPFGVTQQKIENKIIIDPIFTEDSNNLGESILDLLEPLSIPWKKYITVSASNIDHLEIPESLSAYTIHDLSGHTMIETILSGADGCKNKTEVCTISRGVSFERMYSFGISVAGSDQYTVTINQEQSEELMSQIPWTIKENLIYSVVSYNDKNYLLVISTFDKTRTPDAEMKLIGVSSHPATLNRDSVLKYTVKLETWSTYGTDAKITLDSTNSARDSGIITWFEPNTLIVPERSSANATLFIQASDTARNGIYDIRVSGKANGENAGLHCGRTDCPTVQIGDSDWSIRTFGSNTGMGIGSGHTPDNTYLEIELNKEEFFERDIVEITTYLVNNGTEPIVLNEPMNLLIKAIRADSKGYYSHFYGIDARNESDNSITIEPNSKVVLVRPFYWDQMTFENLDEEYRIEEGSRKMTATLVSREHTWKDETLFDVK